MKTHDVRNDLPWHKLAIFIPVFTVLLSAGFVVPHLSVKKENDKVGNVEVIDRGSESGRQTPGETFQRGQLGDQIRIRWKKVSTAEAVE